MSEVRRLHWGCGKLAAPGWINSDIREAPGIDLACDIVNGLPLPDNHLDYIASQHSLGDLEVYQQVKTLIELRRVLKPGGVLRVGLADLDLFIKAYQANDPGQFLIYDWETIDGNFISHMLWYNTIKTPFTYPFAEELFKKAGFAKVQRAAFKQTNSRFPEIVQFDNREAESFFIEGTK
jgi:SAM-dependent methyltransferase